MINVRTELGEGVFWDDIRRVLFWLDINQSILFACFNGKVNKYQINGNASTILSVDNETLHLANKFGIISFCLITGEMHQISQTPTQYSSSIYRANDGVKLNDGLYIYGVMRKFPEKGDGALILSKNGKSKIVYEGIAIPNTFIKIPNSNSLLITDSFMQKTFRFDFDSSWSKVLSKREWFNLEQTKKTPDGGCISKKGRVFLAIWDGFAILELDMNGNIVNEFKIPVPRPTSCALNTKEDKLYITSAYEGLSDLDRKKYPLSGSIFTVKINTLC